MQAPLQPPTPTHCLWLLFHWWSAAQYSAVLERMAKVNCIVPLHVGDMGLAKWAPSL